LWIELIRTSGHGKSSKQLLAHGGSPACQIGKNNFLLPGVSSVTLRETSGSAWQPAVPLFRLLFHAGPHYFYRPNNPTIQDSREQLFAPTRNASQSLLPKPRLPF